MIYHFIAIASGFIQGTRIAWHYASKEKLDQTRIKKFMQEAHQQNSAQFGIHKLSTESLSWDSVVAKDSFFEDIFIIENEEELLRMLKVGKEISALDIAKYILGIKPMSHLKLQKIVYLVYAEYLVRYSKPLFKEKIVAYRYGPVIEELYQQFKEHGAEEIYEPEKYSFTIKDAKIPPLFMKIVMSEQGIEILDTIVETVNKYGDKTANSLVSLTHSPNSPWSKFFVEDYENSEITDDIIKENHEYEIK